MNEMKTSSSSSSRSPSTPVIIDLGKHSKKKIKALRKGKPGKLLSKVAEAIESLQAQDAIARDAQPVVVVVRERGRSLGLLGY